MTGIVKELMLIIGPQRLMVILLGILGTLLHYRKTGKLPLGRLPLRAMRQAWRGISTKYFAKPRPKNVEAIVANAPPEKLDKLLRPIHFEGADLYSYEYKGEVLNLRRPEGYYEINGGEVIPEELHIRGFETRDGRTLLLCHSVASRYEAWSHHIEGTIFSWSRGRQKASAVLSGRGIKHSQIGSEKEAEVEVIS